MKALRSVSVLELTAGTRRAVAPVDSLVCVLLQRPAREEEQSVIDLDPLLGISGRPPASARYVEVDVRGRRRWVRTRAHIRLVELPVACLFRLPAILRHAVPAPWVRGVALLGDGDCLAVWLDLQRMAGGVPTSAEQEVSP